ncbi:type II secretion system protein N [Massilia sp. TS11]|uniref:type II secretion system protein N n=1 Tax=Massilia sp. TS11 TaxID=2908003 RepID=UPI001EDBD04E|nr:type II secretion system protein N [Massilia sp. TS11]MCG2585863.1 type II secretion system protein N [Massilia sp. TS11]
MKRAFWWLLAGGLSAALTVAAFLPASVLGSVVEARTAGRLTLGDAQGTLWRGSAFIGGAAGEGGAVTPLLPGRFSWELSPLSLLGMVRLSLANPEALAQPVSLSGSWTQWRLSAGVLRLPADGLAGLGAPLNTMAPSGTMRLSWSGLDVASSAGQISVQGSTLLELLDMASRLSPLRPLGSYALSMDWRGQQAALDLRTLRGALVLNGNGVLANGRLTFSGRAQAARGYEEALAGLLNLLGQRRVEGDNTYIALEFK